jgi:hypothetical protein
MKLRALPLIFAAILLCGDSASSLSGPHEQTAPQTQPPNPEQPATSSPTPAAPENQTQKPPPSQVPDEKARTAPKPPVLKHKTHKAVSKTAAATHKTHRKMAHKSATEPGKVVVRNGGAKEGSVQLTPATSPVQAQHQRASTANLLAAADANLKRVAGRQLTPAQQSMVDEIHTYMQQAKAAAASADTNRAQTLAYKARLLSDELARK